LARHAIQQMWRGETFTLQLDSHHRFRKDWDEHLITMVSVLQKQGVFKPALTAYVAPYDPEEEESKTYTELDADVHPWQLTARFSGDSILFDSGHIPHVSSLTQPIPARYASAHFFFTLGEHCRDCPYDPDIYFTGEEIFLTVQSFMQGYDLFHPHETVVWHEYTRKLRTKHWDDFDDKNKETGLVSEAWYEMDRRSKTRVKDFLQQRRPLMSSSIRSLRDYELYAGIDFVQERIHPDTLAGKPPPILDPDFFIKKDILYSFVLELPELDLMTRLSLDFIGLFVEDDHNRCIYRKDIQSSELIEFPIFRREKQYRHLPPFLQNAHSYSVQPVTVTFSSFLVPTKWVYWIHTKNHEWTTRFERKLY